MFCFIQFQFQIDLHGVVVGKMKKISLTEVQDTLLNHFARFLVVIATPINIKNNRKKKQKNNDETLTDRTIQSHLHLYFHKFVVFVCFIAIASAIFDFVFSSFCCCSFLFT